MAKKEKKLEVVQKYYIRKKDGEIDYEHPYDLIRETNYKGLYYVRLDEHVGYMNEEGKFVVPISYDFTRTTHEGKKTCYPPHCSWYYHDGNTVRTYVYKNNGIGVINNRGKVLVPCEFEDVNIFPYEASKNFIPVALPSYDNSKLVWGIYDVKNKQVSVTPQYEKIEKDQNGYASFKENGKWGILHCATGAVVVPAIYVINMDVSNTGIVIAFLGGSGCYIPINKTRYVSPNECHVLVVNGSKQAQIVVSGYDWIEKSGPSVMKCRIGSEYKPKQEDSFKILPMKDYIGIVRNASYEAGYFLEESGEFVKEWSIDCTSYTKQVHAKYLSGGIFSAMTYDGKNIPITNKMKQEILKCISEE